MIMVSERYCNASPKPEFYLSSYESVWIEIFTDDSVPYRNKKTDVQLILSL